MVKLRFSPGGLLTGAVAAAALTAFAASASAQTSQDQMGRDSRSGITQREMMMQQERMGAPAQMRDQAQMRERTQMRDQMGAMPGGGTGGAHSMQERLQMWDMDRYIMYQQAVAAHENCRAQLTQPAMRAITQRIEAAAGEPPSPGRKLAIQDDAKFHMKEIIRVEGCADPRVKTALSTFDQSLAPAAHEAVAEVPR